MFIKTKAIGYLFFASFWFCTPLAQAQGAYQVLAQKYLNNQDIPGAIGVYSQVIRNYPENPAPYISRGKLYLGQGQVILALADYTRAIALQPQNSDYYLYRADAYRIMGRHLEAKEDLQEAFALAPHNLKNFAARGLFYLRTGKYQLAIADFNTCLRTRQTPEILALRAEAFQALGQSGLAQRDRAQAKDLGL